MDTIDAARARLTAALAQQPPYTDPDIAWRRYTQVVVDGDDLRVLLAALSPPAPTARA